MASTPETRAAVLAAWLRPLLAVAFLAGVSVWLTCDPAPARDTSMRLAASFLPTPSLPVITPPALADAQPWPRGMVIKPPSTNDRIAVGLAGPLDSLAARLDSLLSALLAPWSATAS